MSSSHGDLSWTIVQAQTGDRQALEAVLIETSRQIAPLLRRIAGNGADDVLQGVLLTVARKLTWLEEPSAFRPWIYRIATRAALRHVTRERRRWPFGSRDDLDSFPEAGERASSPDLDEIPELLAQVTPRSRVVIVLHYLEEMPLDEIAVVLGVPLGTVKSRLAYGLRTMRRAARQKGQVQE